MKRPKDQVSCMVGNVKFEICRKFPAYKSFIYCDYCSSMDAIIIRARFGDVADSVLIDYSELEDYGYPLDYAVESMLRSVREKISLEKYDVLVRGHSQEVSALNEQIAKLNAKCCQMTHELEASI